MSARHDDQQVHASPFLTATHKLHSLTSMSTISDVLKEKSRLEAGDYASCCQSRAENYTEDYRKERHHKRERGERKKKRRHSTESRKGQDLDDSSSRRSLTPTVKLLPSSLDSSAFEERQSHRNASNKTISTSCKATGKQCEFSDVIESRRLRDDDLTSGKKARRHRKSSSRKSSKRVSTDSSEMHDKEKGRSARSRTKCKSHQNGNDTKASPESLSFGPNLTNKIEFSTQGSMRHLNDTPNQKIEIDRSRSSSNSAKGMRHRYIAETPDQVLSPMSGSKVEKLRQSLECYTTSNVGHKADEMLAYVRKAVDEVAAKHEELKLSYISNKIKIHSRERASTAQYSSFSPKVSRRPRRSISPKVSREAKIQTRSNQSDGCFLMTSGVSVEIDKEWEREMNTLFQKWGLQRRPSQRHIERVLTHSASFRLQRDSNKARGILVTPMGEANHSLIPKRSSSLVCDKDGHVEVWATGTFESKLLGRRNPQINAFVSPGA